MYPREHDIHYDQRYETLMVVRSLASYTAAGSVLCLTSSAVSRQIHSIERELGCILFTYEGRRLRPTRECDLVGEYVTRIRSIQHRMGGELTHPTAESRHLAIGATPSTQESVLVGVLDRYREEHPQVQITLRGGNAEELEALLCDRAVDLAVAEEELSSGQLSFVVLDTDHLVVAVARDSSFAKENGITLQQLRGERLIMRAGSSGTRTLFDANIKKAGLLPEHFHIMMELENISTIKKLVAEHYGVSVLSQKACAREVSQGLFQTVPLLGVNMARTIRLYYRRDDPEQPALHELIRIYREQDTGTQGLE